MLARRAARVLFVCLVCAFNVTWAQSSCTPVFETTNFCFNMMATSTTVTLSCPTGYILRIQSANIFKNVGSASCPTPSPAAGPNTCSLLNNMNTFMQNLLSTCAMQSQCMLDASIPNPSVSNCSGLTGVVFAQVVYRCEALHNTGGAARALAINSNTSFTGSLINIDSAALALNSFFVGSTAGYCQLTVPAGVEMFIQTTIFVKANAAAMETCNQRIQVVTEGSFMPPQDMCSMSQPPLKFPCVGTNMNYGISYVTDDPSAVVVFVVQIYVHYTQSVSIYCGAPVPTTTVTQTTSITTTVTQPPPTTTTVTQPPPTTMVETQPPPTTMVETQPPPTTMVETQPPPTTMVETQPPPTTVTMTQPPPSTTTTVKTTTTSRPPVVIPTTIASTTVLVPVGSSMSWPMPLVIGIVVGACVLLIILILLCACACRRRRAKRKATKRQHPQPVLVPTPQPVPVPAGPAHFDNQVIVTRTDILRDANPASRHQAQSLPLGPATAYTDSTYGGGGIGGGFGSPSSLLGLSSQQHQPALAGAASMPNLLTVRDYTPYTSDQGYATSAAALQLAGAQSIPYGINVYQPTSVPSHLTPGVNHLRPTTVVVSGDPSGITHRPGDVSYPPVGRPGSTVVYQ